MKGIFGEAVLLTGFFESGPSLFLVLRSFGNDTSGLIIRAISEGFEPFGCFGKQGIIQIAACFKPGADYLALAWAYLEGKFENETGSFSTLAHTLLIRQSRLIVPVKFFYLALFISGVSTPRINSGAITPFFRYLVIGST